MKRVTCVMAIMAAFGSSHAELNHQYVEVSTSYLAYERDVGDVTGDGLNDLVCVREGDTSAEVFVAPSWSQSRLITFTGTYRYPRADDFKVADINGDGDVDVVVRLGSGPSDDGAGIAVWYEQPDAGTNWVQHLIGNSTEYTKDICVADLDRDGRLDVAMRMDSQTQVWLQETNNAWTEVVLSHPSHEGMEVADVDMDGDPDIVLNGFWFPTPNTPAACRVAGNYVQQTIDSAWFTQTGDWTANSCKVSIGDIDGDGSNDVVFSQSERAGYPVAWYKRAGASWTQHVIANVDYAHNLQAYDVDGDGDVDVLSGGMVQSNQKGLRFFLNQGGGSSWTTSILQSDGSYSAELGDIDNDGDLDIVGIRNWDSTPTYIYRSNASGGPSLDFWRYIEVTDQHTLTFGLAVVDVDGDNDLDLASGPYIYRNPGGSMEGTWSRTSFSGAGHAFAAADVDGDANTDLITQLENVGQDRIDLYWVEAADAGASAWAPPVLIGNVPRSDHPQGFQGHRIAQIVAGGRPELVVSSFQGPYYFEIPASPAAGNWPRVFITANDSDEGIGAGDIDGDGDIDIAFSSGGTKAITWARNPGDGSPNWPVFTIGSFPEADWPDRCAVADLNGDSRMDVVVTEENAGGAPDALACWWEQPSGGPTNASWTRHTLVTQYSMNNLDAADFDGDGDTDLAIAEHKGTLKIDVWENDGTGGFVRQPVGEGNESHLGAKAFDLDGDGDLDLASIAYDAPTRLHVWRNDSPSGVPTVAKPVISPNGGVFDGPVAVSLTCSTTGAIVRFTTNGTDVTEMSPAYAAPFVIATSATVKARGFKEGFATSVVATAIFTGPQVQAVAIAPNGGAFQGTQTVTLACATTGITIRFTTNGMDPDETSPTYAGPIVLTTTTTLRARAFRAGLTPSAVASATFTKFTLGAVAHWRLDERFGSIAYDSSGSAHHGSVSGAIGASGIRDRSLQFDGIDDHVDVGSWNVAGQALTVCGWVRVTAPYADNDARIVSKAVGPSEQDHTWMLSLTTSGGQIRPRFRLKTGGSTSTLIASSGSISPGTWAHVAAVYDGATMRLYLDGVEVGSTAKSGDITTSSAAILLGANPPTIYAPLFGALDDIRIYNIALSGAQVAAVMAETPSPAQPVVSQMTSANGAWVLSSSATPGRYLILDQSTNLISGAWLPVSTSAPEQEAVLVVRTNEAPHAVFRLRME